MKEYKYTINGTKYEVAIGDIVENIANVTVNGEEYKVEMEREPEPEKKKVVVKTGVASETPADNVGETNAANIDTSNALKAPLPGTIIEVKVKVGDAVNAGDTLVVLEAMKMANNLESEKAGTVKAVLVKEGDSVMEDTPLVVVE